MNRKILVSSISAIALYASGAVNLSGAGDSHVFEGVICSEVDLSEVTVDGRAFDPARDRLSIYGNGSIVIADGWTSPLVIYNAENCQGDSKTLDRDLFYRGKLQGKKSTLPEEELGAFDNSVRSFRLKRGFSCTLANNADGTGYSRVFIADNEDLVVNTMPEGLDFVSFVRVCRHDWVGKRGVSGGELPAITRSAWFYDWGAGAESTADYEYIPMRHQRWWDSWENIGSRTSTTAVLGFNEPDHTDQANMTTDEAIELWPELMKSGLRVGSPAPDNINKEWLREFLAKADSLNYRVDFVATHMYWNSQDPYNLANTIADLCKNRYGGRPMWITEWNNGANWTHEWWPDAKGPKRDADFNIIYDENGNTTEVTRPHTEANSEVQCEWLAKALDAFDKCDWLERHSFYSWVEDARTLEINGKLTPAGRLFAEFNSRPAFNRSTEYIHKWRIAPPRITSLKQTNGNVRINFYDHNGETAVGYHVERRINGGPWEEIAYIVPGDYRQGYETYYRDTEKVGGFQQYRLKAHSYKDTKSKYSRIVGVDVPTGISDVEAGPEFSVRAAAGKMVIESEVAGSAPLYSLDGRMVRMIDYCEGTTTVDNLPRGIYLFQGQKLAI